MATRTTEQALVEQLATEFESIDGIETTYGFAQNPDTLNQAALPAVLFVPTAFDASLKAHHNRHRNEIEITAICFVAPRQSAGGRLKFIENRAIPLMGKTRARFQTEAVIIRLLNVGNLTSVTSFTGAYGAGGPLLTHSGDEYIGSIYRWKFLEII